VVIASTGPGTTNTMTGLFEVRAGRPQPGAVEIPIDQQYRRAEMVVPDLRKDTACTRRS